MSILHRARHRTYEILWSTRDHDRVSAAVNWFIITLIIFNVAVVVVATVGDLGERYQSFFNRFELVSVIIFGIEYLARVWACVEAERFGRPVRGRLRFMATPSAMIDLLAIAPFFILRFTAVDLRAFRALRLFRLFRLLKLGRYSSSIAIFGDVLRDKKEQIVIALLLVLVLLLFSSSVMYFAERDAQPEAFSSIPSAMWWGVATLTTVGYGDVHPVTTLGKVFGGVIAMLGIGLFALPAGILSSGFEEALSRKGEDKEEDEGDEQKQYCPCCGKKLEEAAEEEEEKSRGGEEENGRNGEKKGGTDERKRGGKDEGKTQRTMNNNEP